MYLAGPQYAIYGFGDEKWRPIGIDYTTQAINNIDYPHHEIHAGSHYFINNSVTMAINNIFDMQFVTPNTTKWSHFLFALHPAMEISWFIYEGATITNTGTGTPVTSYNSNRNSTNISGNKIFTQLQGTTASALLDTSWTGATLMAKGLIGSNKDGGFLSRENEIILKQNTTYLMRGIANAGGEFAFNADWYEHTNKT